MNKYEKNFFEDNKNLREEVNKLEKELLEVYKCLYPNFEDIIKDKLPQSVNFVYFYNSLNILRDHHKKQLEKEKMKKLIKECMEEINKEKE